MSYSILEGDVIDRLRELPDDSVQCVVTSPPYWGLRDYGVEGQIGLEKTPQEFVAKMVAVFREVRRVLRKDGTCWVNMGDSYATGTTSKRNPTATGKHGYWENPAVNMRINGAEYGLKPKDLCGMPWRLAFALQNDGWWLRQDIIWSKPNPMPESVTDRCTKAHEYMFLLTKSAKCYFDADAIKEPVSGGAHMRAPGNKTHKGVEAYEGGAREHRTKAGLLAYSDRVGREGKNSRMHQDRDPNHSAERKQRAYKMPDGWDTGAGSHGTIHRAGREKGRHAGVGPKASAPDSGTKYNESFSAAVVDLVDFRNKRDVWEIATQPYPEAHFATFPEALVQPCILAGSKPGDTVLDPFSGSGTTGVVALRYHRKYIGIELNPEYAAMSRRRIEQDQPLFNTSERTTA